MNGAAAAASTTASPVSTTGDSAANASESASESVVFKMPQDGVWGFTEAVKRNIHVTDHGGNKLFSDDGKTPVMGWMCLLCGQQFRQVSATKAMYHLARQGGMNVRPCTASIPQAQLEKYQKYRDIKVAGSSKRSRKSIELEMDGRQLSIATAIESKRVRSSQSVQLASSISSLSSSGGTQVTLEASNATRLSTAIADFLFSKGLPFDTVDCMEFQQILRLAKTVPGSYKVPNQHYLADSLLDISYKHHMKSVVSSLSAEGVKYGVAIYGDGATVQKMPLTNVMASSGMEHNAVLDIVDASEHMANGGKKTAEYIANLFEPYISQLDSSGKGELVDLVLFDGAANVQKAGEILAARHPRITSMHGVEHQCSLVFADAADLWQVKLLVRATRFVYSVLGSGSRHAPYAVFQKFARDSNGGKPIGLIRAADTRMAGHFYAMHRMMRLKGALEATVHSLAFNDYARRSGKQKAKLEVRSSLFCVCQQ